jgi:NAD(P)-dependent dehydrogenase (short-subunit alcohol dehydrogenase family)
MRVDAWQPADIPDQAGHTVVVTGTTVGGLGHHAALELARRGARVVLSGRSPGRLQQTAETIRSEVPAAELDELEVDLSDLGSVRRAAETASAYGPLDLLVNNAGVMGTRRQVTADGLDLQLATNHFGPFLLTGLLLPQLLASKDARVVTVSSLMHRIARRAPLDDPHVHRGRYATWQVYGRSKLANLLFTYELQRRLAGSNSVAVAAHPGGSSSELSRHLPGPLKMAFAALEQDTETGALPTLRAATDPAVGGGQYFGPGGFMEMRGNPKAVSSNRRSRDTAVQRRLWAVSEELTGVTFDLPPAS